MGRATQVALAIWFAGLVTLIALTIYTYMIYNHDIYVVVRPVNITGAHYQVIGDKLFLTWRNYTIQQPLLLHYNPAIDMIANTWIPIDILWAILGIFAVGIVSVLEDEKDEKR